MDLPDPGIQLVSPALQEDSLPTELSGKPPESEGTVQFEKKMCILLSDEITLDINYIYLVDGIVELSYVLTDFLLAEATSVGELLRSLAAQCKESACSAGDAGNMGSIPGSGRSPGGGHVNPLQYSCQEDSTGRGVWWAIVQRIAKRRMRLSTPTIIVNSFISPCISVNFDSHILMLCC